MKRFNPRKLFLACLAALALGGCSTIDVVDDLVLQQAAFDRCFEAAAARSDKAVTGKSPALYHIAAKSMRDCVIDIHATAAFPRSDKAIHASALTIINYVKAGELEVASNQVRKFQSAYPRRDLYLADGTSFIESMQLLLGEVPGGAAERGSLVNASPQLKSELRRKDYWQSH